MTSLSNKNSRSRITEMYIKEHLIKENKISIDHPKFSSLQHLNYLKNDVQKYILNFLLKKNEFVKFNILPKKILILFGIKSIGKKFFLKSICIENNFNFLEIFIENVKDVKDFFKKSVDMIPCLCYLEICSDEKEKIIYEIKKNLNKIENLSILIIIGCKNRESCESFENLISYKISMRIPTENDRKKILESFLLSNFQNIDLNFISKNTPGYLPRDLYNLCVSACSEAILKNRKIEINDFLLQLESQKKISLDDIGALDRVKEELKMNIILPLEYPEKFSRMGINISSGILLYGPPGCGKTMLAKAIANMLFCNFMSVSGPELINKYVGDTEKELREIFNKARNQEPCVLFFDEIDSLCSKRGNNDFQTRVVNQMLTLLDGVDEKGKVFVIGATNRIDALDKAIIRPGRFDKVLEVPLPNKFERIDIFRKCIKNIPILELHPENYDMENFSGADIAGLVREASYIALKENFWDENVKITEDHILNALNDIKARKERFEDQ